MRRTGAAAYCVDIQHSAQILTSFLLTYLLVILTSFFAFKVLLIVYCICNVYAAF